MVVNTKGANIHNYSPIYLVDERGAMLGAEHHHIPKIAIIVQFPNVHFIKGVFSQSIAQVKRLFQVSV